MENLISCTVPISNLLLPTSISLRGLDSLKKNKIRKQIEKISNKETQKIKNEIKSDLSKDSWI